MERGALLKTKTSMVRTFLHYTLSVMLLIVVAACGDGGDYTDGSSSNESSFTITYTKDNTTAYVTQLLTHTVGNGFPIVIMADGYTQSEIDNGAYRTAVNKTITSLFAKEPMASMKAYFDVYEVAAASSVSGITTTKSNTAFSTYFTSSDGVEIEGNTDKIENYAWMTLGRSNSRFNDSQIIVLVNSNRYAGITLISYRSESADSIPSGLSLSYMPVGCISGGKSYFTEVLQHEAVGHGIGKLADEYYDTYTSPSEEDITKYKSQQKAGVFLNTKYDADTENDKIVGNGALTINSTRYKIVIGAHNMQPGELGYLFANDGGYADDEVMWYQGGSLYLTLGEPYDGPLTRYAGYYSLEKNFYRSTWSSIMNSVFENGGDEFNVLSRYIIYARILKVAQGSPGNIHNEDLMRRFMQFDKWYGITSSTAAGAKGVGGTFATEETSLPPLARPKVIRID